MTLPARRLALAVFVFVAVVLCGVCAQRPLPDCSRKENTDLVNQSLWLYCKITQDNHVFSSSSDALLTRSLPPAAADDVRFFERQMAQVSTLALKKRRDESLAPVCARIGIGWESDKTRRDWLEKTRDYARSIMEDPILNTHCLTRVVHTDDVADDTAARLRSFTGYLVDAADRLRARAQAGKSAVDRMVRGWPAVVGDLSAGYLDNVYQCTVRSVVGVRVRGRWGVHAKLTNDVVDVPLAEGSRQYLHELLSADGRGQIRALTVNAWREGGAGMENATTTLSLGGGRPPASEFLMTEAEGTPALQSVLGAHRKQRSLAQETVFSSNVAILVLPMVMTLVPISSIDYVEMPLVVLYAIFTDVFSTLPLLVKGLELLALPDDGGCESWVHGVEETDPLGTVIVETWCAGCKARTAFRAYGKAFVASALFFMILGVTMEWVVRRRVVKRIKGGKVLPRRFWSWGEIRGRAKGAARSERSGSNSSPASTTRSSIGSCGSCNCAERLDLAGEQDPAFFARSRNFLRTGSFHRSLMGVP